MRLTLLLMLLFFMNLFAADPITIAVNDLEGQNLDSATVSILSNRVRSELINTNAYTVVERGEMAAILQEQGFQQTGACSESSCLVEIGQLLGVRQMVAGTVGKLNDNFYTISLRMIDVGSGKIINSASYDHAGTLERLLSEGLTTAVGKLIRSSVNEGGASVYSGLTGDLFVASSIPGASITIDGNETGMVTPNMFESYPAGPHEIVLRKDNYIGILNVTVPSKDLLKIEIPMKEIRSSLLLKSTPIGVDVYMGKVAIGKTPLKIDTLPTGSYQFVLRQVNYKPLTTTINLENGKTENISLTLEPSATISISSLPDSAKLTINGKVIGITPWKSDTLSVGKNSITLSMPNYDDTTEIIEVAQGETLKRNYTLHFSQKFLQERHKKRQWARRVMFGLLATGGTVFGILSNKELEEARATYDSEKTYNKDTHDSNWKAVENAKLKRTIGYSVAGAFGLGFSLSIPF